MAKSQRLASGPSLSPEIPPRRCSSALPPWTRCRNGHILEWHDGLHGRAPKEHDRAWSELCKGVVQRRQQLETALKYPGHAPRYGCWRDACQEAGHVVPAPGQVPRLVGSVSFGQ